MSEYPFEGKENVLLDRMIYEGKIKYLIHQAFPELKPEVLMGYTETSYNWCKENESNLWKAIIERKHLYTPDLMTTNKYFDNSPQHIPGKRRSRKSRQLARLADYRQIYARNEFDPRSLDAKQR